ncbi:hypothetical protein NUW58_g2196 [Xylaria curta]|uniref:Uncharacterized protein n=1 Tax=Xylaria curta TaxID=42375 RepID=A0ACC1PI34_9PEZI|nr:hypothetical protein NUW58_g2196 [Xylaria curta]
MSDLDFSHLSQEDLMKALEGPALIPPEGTVPNFNNPPNLNHVAVTALVVCLVLASAFLLVRVYVKLFKIKRLCVGDYLIVLAYICYLVAVSGSLLRVRSKVALFVHQWNVRGQDIENYNLHIFIGIEFWLVAVLLVKSSILLEWLRIFAPTGSRPFTMSCKVLLVVNVIFYTAALLTLNLACQPFRKTWNKTVEGTCIDSKSLHLCAVIVNLILDLAILILPQPVIWRLQMTTPRKIGVSTVFAIGILAIAASGFLLDAVVAWIRTNDMTYYYSSVALWAIAEITCGILVSCVPFVPRLVRDIDLSKWFANVPPLGKSITRRRVWFQEPSGERQPRPRISNQHNYREIGETGGIRLRGVGSPRPTDRQYGIAVTTDIVVTESYKSDHVKLEDLQYPWAATV